MPLIFDEVYSGFRLAPGGAQAYFGVQADMVAYGKTVAGGMPIGVVCGRKDLMQRFDPRRPMRIAYVTGTFSAHPAVMGAMVEFLTWLVKPEAAHLYEEARQRCQAWADDTNAKFIEQNLPLRVVNFTTIWTLLFKTPSRYNWLLQYYLRAEGVALLLSLERLFYVWVWRHPETFSDLCRRPALRFLGTPVDGVQRFFYLFKSIQVGVFLAWCGWFADGTIGPAGPMVMGLVLILAGQVLNVSVFYRLGKVGVYYGVRFGHEVPWCRAFPFSLLKHSQYVGAVLSIWGFFLSHAVPARRLVRAAGPGDRVLRLGCVLRTMNVGWIRALGRGPNLTRQRRGGCSLSPGGRGGKSARGTAQCKPS